MGERVKGWRTTAMGVVSLVYCNTREQARAITVREANEAGYDVRYIDVHAVRAPDRDAPCAGFQRGMCLTW